MHEIFPSGSILILFFSGTSGSSFISNNKDHIPVNFKDNKGYIYLNKPLTKQELINDYMFLQSDEYYITKYKMYC